jgi:TrmH family RNA methyltransferase
MGSIARVSCRYETNLASCLTALEKPIFGADGTGRSLYKTQLPKAATYVFGSESHGLSEAVNGLLEAKIAIPNLRSGQGAESLNVATATAIFLSEIFRGAQSFKGDD